MRATQLLLVHALVVLEKTATAFTSPMSTAGANRQTPRSAHVDDCNNHDESLRDPPKLVVFDLDNTLWTPELYQLRKLDRNGQFPVANNDVKLFPGAESILARIAAGEYDPQTKFAIASRTNKAAWANDLLDQFQIRRLFHHVEIFPSNKRKHFAAIAQASGVGYHEMLFFDDARGGRFGNCEPVSDLGVLSVHCPAGLQDEDVFHRAYKFFQHGWDGTPSTIVEWDGAITSQTRADGNALSMKPALADARQNGKIQRCFHDKRYGFIRYGDRKTKDVFFHFNALPEPCQGAVAEGDRLSFQIVRDDRSGKLRAESILVVSDQHQSQSQSGEKNDSQIELRAFSMNMPFAALLANEHKTLETRNGTMFAPYPAGSFMLLHVGQRIYPDGNKHVDVMKSGGLNDVEIDRLKSLPKGFGKGSIVAICEIGETFETTLEQRSKPDFQRKVAAYGTDSGCVATVIKRAAYLKRPIMQSGKGGVFKIKIDQSVLPDEWLEDIQNSLKSSNDAKRSNNAVYSISG